MVDSCSWLLAEFKSLKLILQRMKFEYSTEWGNLQKPFQIVGFRSVDILKQRERGLKCKPMKDCKSLPHKRALSLLCGKAAMTARQ